MNTAAFLMDDVALLNLFSAGDNRVELTNTQLAPVRVTEDVREDDQFRATVVSHGYRRHVALDAIADTPNVTEESRCRNRDQAVGALTAAFHGDARVAQTMVSLDFNNGLSVNISPVVDAWGIAGFKVVAAFEAGPDAVTQYLTVDE